MAGLARFFSQTIQDVRYALRSLAASPAFTIAAIVTIGLGVGVNSGVFSVLNGIVFAELPVTGPAQLVAVSQNVTGVPRGSNNWGDFSTAEYEAYRDRSETLSGLLAYGRMWAGTLGGDAQQMAVTTPVSCNYFQVLELPLRLGPGLGAEHCASPGDAAVAVIAYDLWVSRFGSDPDVLGRSVTINGNRFQIVGVAPEGFTGIDIDRAAVFVPMAAQRLLRPDRDYLDNDTIGWLNVVGRRRPGASMQQVGAELGVIAGQLDQAQEGRESTVAVSRATRASAPEMRTGLLAGFGVVLAAFGLVLLVACTNVANLMLARADSRIRETAIRLSLGATRGRLVRQLLTESVLIALAGGAAGTVLALWTFGGMITAAMSALPPEVRQVIGDIDAAPDARVFLFALGVSLIAGLVFGFTPALTATRPDLRMAIEQDTPGAGRHVRGRLQGILVGVQVAFCMVLVITTALLLRGFHAAQTLDPDFDFDELVVAGYDLGAFGYDAEQAAVLQRQAIERARGLPGVEAVAQALLTPLEPRSRTYAYRTASDGEDFQAIGSNVVSSNYFAVTGIPIVRGRAFSEAETAAEKPTVVIVTESTAARLWPGQNPVGQTMTFLGFEERLLEVVGVARDTQVSTIGVKDTSYVYLPATTNSQTQLQLVLRTAVPADTLRPGIESIMSGLDSRLPVTVRPLEYNFDFWRSLSRVAVGFSIALGLLALIIASVGVYGVLSTVVGRRVREIGIRLALGADRADVLKLTLRKSMTPVIVGALVGAAACFGVAKLLSALLFGIGALDPYALAGAAAVVIGAAFLASAAPARRAMNVDPMTTLRYE